MDSIDRLHLWIDALNTHVDTCDPKHMEHVDARFQSLEGQTLILHLIVDVSGCFQPYTLASIW